MTTFMLAVALFVPDTMEVVDYREGEPRANWRQRQGFLSWRPSLNWALAVIALFAVIFVNLNKFTEFLYYQF
jgi:hypothetical protein